MGKSVYAHIDCNNFYASCERVFKPDLRNKPIVILSNNDGCIIARSNKAKELGVEMGAPLFKQRDLITDKKICVRSSNYPLYGDMSRRVLQTLRHLTDKVEPYSIDEAFVELPKMTTKDLASFGQHIKSMIWQWTGLPVSVGIAPSKTLAKIANETAKGHPEYQGVLNLTDNVRLDSILEETQLTDIWGIGRGLSQRLHKENITNALQLKHQIDRRQWIRKKLHVTGLRTVMELNGQPCLDIEDTNEPRKGIMTSRSFGEAVTAADDLQEAVAQFISIAAEKLRAQQSVASLLHITLRTNKYSKYKSKYKYSIEYPLPAPTANTAYLIKCGHACIDYLYEKDLRYKKAAVMLTGIIPQSEVQKDLFNDAQYSAEQYQLMQKVDDINTKYGSDMAHFAATGFKQTWKMKQEHLSSKYTTSWDGLMEAQSS
ncbi:Y-family DNA polymerase [Fodinibius salsisoli]|uniref:Y-family DNA polymerase n=1 Tax=Fodinibius salsisoli TaxID=2820877 RepID=A0ABT3PRW3_9BACT|nr:Y-family DNA polymerase [Fodinibius salsisoli]MCW9708604.1 Y-family DNA polymerase [Fodinibius salsisoli]